MMLMVLDHSHWRTFTVDSSARFSGTKHLFTNEAIEAIRQVVAGVLLNEYWYYSGVNIFPVAMFILTF